MRDKRRRVNSAEPPASLGVGPQLKRDETGKPVPETAPIDDNREVPTNRREWLGKVTAKIGEIIFASLAGGAAGGLVAVWVNRRQQDADFSSKLKIFQERFRSGIDSPPMVNQLRELLIANEDVLDEHPDVRHFYEKHLKDGNSPHGRIGETMTGESLSRRYKEFLRDLRDLRP